MLHINRHKQEYFPIQSFWEPHRELSDILQPWKNPKYWNSASHPVAMSTLVEFLRVALQHEGDVAEFGVFKGGSAILIANELAGLNKNLHLLDTFEGIPNISDRDNYWKVNDFSNTDVNAVRSLFSSFDFVHIHQGKFSETLCEIEKEKFCFVHVDSDTYESVRDVTKFVFPRMNKGGIIVYDDYGDWVSQGAKRAVDEFYSSINRKFAYLPSKQAVVFCD